YNSAEELFQSAQTFAISQVTEDEFDVKWRNFCFTYDNKSDVIAYIEETWMLWKERFVKAWTDKIFHLGTTVTSCIESSHSTIKAYLQTSTKQIYIPAFVHNNALYANLWGKVSSFALNKINEQYQKANNATAQEPLPPCT
ncbi:3049_t:CDS:2, partial [Cetraspora pellucida]